jgi:hypothetical protein
MDIDNSDLIEFRRQDRANLGLPPVDEDMILDDGVSEATSATLRPSSRSLWSTPTVEGMSEVSAPAFTGGFPSADRDMDLTETSSQATSNEPSFIIATDFGTTFSSVAFAKREHGQWGDPQSISNYSSDPMPWGKNSLEVPTESWYPNVAITRDTSDELGSATIDEDPMADIFKAAENQYQATRTLVNISSDGDEEMADSSGGLPEVDDDTDGIIWGYDIQERLKAPDMDHSQYERVARSKLILDNTPNTQEVRDKLRPVLKRLAKRKTINKDEDIISDYLRRLFQHTKDQLVRYHGLPDTAYIEHVLCVPNVWSPASSRKMQKAMEKAIRDSGLGSMENLFIVAEPEAAAAYVLDRNNNVMVRRLWT